MTDWHLTDWQGAIDCDVHPKVPNMQALTAHMSDYWRDTVDVRGISGFISIAYPDKAPLTRRPDWQDGKIRFDEHVDRFKTAVMDRLGFAHAICNPLYAIQLIRDENMAAAFASAVNDWLKAEWLDHDPRLRGSIVVAPENAELAVEEIERLAPDKRYVQVLFLCMGEHPLGKSRYWPIYAAAERHGLTIGIHAGSAYYHPPTPSGWPSHYVEDYAAQALGFHTQLGSLVAEGVFVKYPKLKAVLIESGVTWLPSYIWRLSKFWRGIRTEVPWIDRSPIEIVRDHIRLTIQPFDSPAEGEAVQRVLDQIGSDDMLLFASDFPHWHYDGDAMLPAGISEPLRRKIFVDNALAAYPRLGTTQGGSHAA